MVGPAVVPTLDPGSAVFTTIQEPRRPVTADIEKSAERPIFTPHHQNAVAPEIECDEVSRALGFVFVPHELPAFRGRTFKLVSGTTFG